MVASELNEKVFDVVFECDAVNLGKMRNDMVVRMIEPDKAEFELATDEGAFHGGDGTAPLPLMLFAGGLASCLLTQLRAFSKRLRIPVGEMRVGARLHWRGRQTGRDPYVSEPVAFALDIELQSDASVDDQIRLIAAAKKGCFIEQTLSQGNEISHRLKTTDGWVDA